MLTTNTVKNIAAAIIVLALLAGIGISDHGKLLGSMVWLCNLRDCASVKISASIAA